MTESDRATQPAKQAARTVPKWESEARERLRLAVRNASKALNALVSRDANEGDTRLFVTDFLCEALGYDKYADLTTEYLVKGEFADYGIRLDKELMAFIEVKRITTKLNSRHLRQVEMYAVNEGVEWMILTNAQNWLVYHLSPGMPVEIDLTLEVDLLASETPARKIDSLLYLTRESMKRRQIDELWKARRATSPRSLAQALCSPPVVEAIRKELRSKTRHNAENGEILSLLKATVIRPECLS